MNKYQKLINQISRLDMNRSHKHGLQLSVSFKDFRKMHKEITRGYSLEFIRRYKEFVKGKY